MSSEQRRRPQLTSWSLRNFKSIEDATINFSPLTLITGVNSSGKSSLIQSILLFAQAFGQRPREDGTEFPMNGDLVTLGGFSDVFRISTGSRKAKSVDDGEERDEIQIAAAFQPRRPVVRRPPRMGRGEAIPAWAAEYAPAGIEEIKVELSISDGSQRSNTNLARVVESKTSIRTSDKEELVVEIESLDSVSPGREAAADLARRLGSVRDIDEYETAVRARAQIIEDSESDHAEEPEEISAVRLVGGFPSSLLIETPAIDYFILSWWNRNVLRRAFQLDRWPEKYTSRLEAEIADQESRQSLGDPLGDLAERAFEDLIDFFERVKDDDGGIAAAPPKRQLIALVQRLRQRYDMSGSDPDHLFRQFSESVKERFDDHAFKPDGSPEGEEVLAPPPNPNESAWPMILDQAWRSVDTLMSQSIMYLGPLRQDPNIQQRTPAASVGSGIGSRGELAAATYNEERNREIQAPMPGEEHARRVTLDQAIDAWARALGITSDVQSEDLGRVGWGLKVNPPNFSEADDESSVQSERVHFDLTRVGVGVSQLLPILILCLRTPPDGIILLEQPELHLHPAIQQKLADFFLACVKSGRQLIVETHSEHLVSRLRRRTAEAIDDEGQGVSDWFAIYFAEIHDGSTHFREVETNSLGGIDDWPEGFFDQALDESRAILRSGLSKANGENRKQL